jgi:hypothetical protein
MKMLLFLNLAPIGTPESPIEYVEISKDDKLALKSPPPIFNEESS